jgi:hypothetical protein
MQTHSIWWLEGTHHMLSILSLNPTSATQQQLFVHTQISLYNYTFHHSLQLIQCHVMSCPACSQMKNYLSCSSIFTISRSVVTTSSWIAAASVRALTCPRSSHLHSSPLWLDSQASPTVLSAGPCTQQSLSTPHVTAGSVRTRRSGESRVKGGMVRESTDSTWNMLEAPLGFESGAVGCHLLDDSRMSH